MPHQISVVSYNLLVGIWGLLNCMKPNRLKILQLNKRIHQKLHAHTLGRWHSEKILVGMCPDTQGGGGGVLGTGPGNGHYPKKWGSQKLIL